MNQTKYAKCRCQRCGESIEFPAHGLGLAVKCPHCGQRTTLLAVANAGPGLEPLVSTEAASPAQAAFPARAPASSPEANASPEETAPGASPGIRETRPKRRRTAPALLALGLAVTAGFLWSHRNWFNPAKVPEHSRELPATSDPPASATNLVSEKAVTSPAVGTSPKSSDDFKPGRILLEKAKGTSLVYAVGVLKNDSDYQRFGVNLELELTDARGNKVGTAKDYRAVLEPRQEWRFRALVLDSRAVSARVAVIREEE